MDDLRVWRDIVFHPADISRLGEGKRKDTRKGVILAPIKKDSTGEETVGSSRDFVYVGLTRQDFPERASHNPSTEAQPSPETNTSDIGSRILRAFNPTPIPPLSPGQD